MPICVRAVDAYNLIILELTGKVTEADLRASGRTLASSKNRIENYDLLIRGKADLQVEVAGTLIRQLAAGESILSAGSKRVILATTPVTFGIGRMYASSGNQNVMVCDSSADAADHLKIDHSEFARLCPP